MKKLSNLLLAVAIVLLCIILLPTEAHATNSSGKVACPIKPATPIIWELDWSYVTLVERDGYEYRINNGAWTTSPTFTDLEPETTYTVYQRIAETDTEYASESSVGLKFTTPICLVVVEDAQSNYDSLRYHISLSKQTSQDGNKWIVCECSFDGYSCYVTMENKSTGILFQILTQSYNSQSGNLEGQVSFELTRDSSIIDIYCGMFITRNGSVLDGATVEDSISKVNYSPSQKFNYNVSSLFGAISRDSFNEFFRLNIGYLCSYLDDYLSSKLWFGLKGLGFRNYPGQGDIVCDFSCSYHIGKTVLLGSREVSCLVDGYTGDTLCVCCGETLSTGVVIPCRGTHTYQSAYDKDCDKCGEERRVAVCSHQYSAWMNGGDGTHSRTCSICKDVQTSAHTLDQWTVTKEATCKEAGSKTATCTTCNATQIVVIPQLTTHSYSGWAKIDDNSHNRVCAVCQKEETVAHKWDAGKITTKASCKQDGVKTYTCADCNATRTEVIPKGEHTWDSKVTKEATCKEEGVKTYTCSTCQTTKTETIAKSTKHTYKNDCDTDCNVCGATRTITHKYKTSWSKDKTGHWHECSVCGDKKDFAEHKPGAAATEEKAQTCTVCKYVITPQLAHTHKYSEDWEKDESNHWHACSGCEEKGSFEAHIFDNACDTDCNACGFTRTTEHTYKTEWSKDASGHWHECSECGAKTDEATHIPGAEATETTAQTCTECGYELAPIVVKPEPDDNGGSTTIIIVACVVGVAAIGGGAALFFIKKKH